MSGRLVLVMTAVIIGLQVVGELYGFHIEVYAVVAMALIVAGLLQLREYRTRRLRERLQEMSPDIAARQLRYLEQSELRPDLLDGLDLPAEIVPLRGTAERFMYPASSGTVMRVMACACLFMVGILAWGAISDPSLNPVNLEYLLIMAGAVAAAAFFGYSAWNHPMAYEVTDRHLVLEVRGVQRKVILWDEVRSATWSRAGGYVKVRGPSVTIQFSHFVIDWDRLLNLVQSRSGNAWQAR